MNALHYNFNRDRDIDESMACEQCEICQEWIETALIGEHYDKHKENGDCELPDANDTTFDFWERMEEEYNEKNN